jgi:ribonuclease J
MIRWSTCGGISLAPERLRVRIHRGAVEIGGSCVELEYQGDRLVLDLGLPLDAGLDGEVPLPSVRGLSGDDPSLRGVVISHGHPDHYGLATRIAAEIPIYIGAKAAAILREALYFSPAGADFQPRAVLQDRNAFSVGPFTVTPYLVDHSAFDGYALLVACGDQRIFYTGDLRAHGRDPELFASLIEDPPRNIDALLFEGTRVGRTGTDASTEQGVEDRCVELFERTDGLALVAYSPQNVDRLKTVHAAARRAGRTFVMDLYAATIAAATDDAAVPRPDWDGVGVYVPQAQRVKVKRSGEFQRVDSLRPDRISARNYPGGQATGS